MSTSEIGKAADAVEAAGEATAYPDDRPPYSNAAYQVEVGKIRRFDTGATRDTDEGKLDYEGFLSPLVLERYAQFMHEHRHQSDGTLRAGDNWQKGMPLSSFMKSGWRHFMDWWKKNRSLTDGSPDKELEDAICGVLFNASGYLHEVLVANVDYQASLPESEVSEDGTGD